MLEFVKYLHPQLIDFFEAQDRDTAIEHLIKLCHQEKKIEAMEPFFTKVRDREKIVSTGIGMSVALPHAKMPHLKFFVAIGILSKGVDWQALDGHPIRLVFLIGGPDDKQTEYLKILSSITSLIKDEAIRKKILTSTSPAAMMKIITGVKNGSKTS